MGTVQSTEELCRRTDRQDLAQLLYVREASPSAPPQPKLLDRVREPIRTRHYSRRTEKVSVHWIRGSSYKVVPSEASNLAA
jgi:hypothetical protein